MDLDEKLIEMSRSGLFWRLGMGWRTWMEEKGGGTGAEVCIYEKGESENEIWQAAGQARTSKSSRAGKQTLQTQLLQPQLGPCIQTAQN